MKTDAPNFQANYPLGGERIGRAWISMWEMLDRRGFQCGSSLAEVGAAQGSVLDKTARNLLSLAVNAGILEQRRIACKATGHSHHRRPLGYRVDRGWQPDLIS